MRRSAPLMLLSLLPMAALAVEVDAGGIPLKLSGFGTVGAAYSSEKNADYLVDEFKPNGPGYTHNPSFDADTRVGLQLSAQFTPSVSAVLQVIAQQNYQNSYRPGVEWANVRWQPMPDLALRAGRVVLPVFMVSDTRRVGYANPWVRPPVELYSMIPVTFSDGFDAAYRVATGPAMHNLQATFGTSDSHFPAASGFEPSVAKVRDIAAAFDNVEIGPATLRVSYGQAKLNIPSYQQFSDAFAAFGPIGQAIADKYTVVNKRITFVGLGAAYDPGAWFVQAEWARFKTNSVLGTKEAGYVSGGYRFGKLTPYATYARSRLASNLTEPGLPVAALPPAVQPTAAFLNGLLNQQLNFVPRQSTASVGLRWDVFRNAAVKVQYDHIDLDDGSHGPFGNLQPGFTPGGRSHLYSAVLDFVF
jgi:hypothetical protein